MNRVFRFIDNNLGADLSLAVVAEKAFFSPFHFHRVFKYITDETLHEYVNRRRMEKSAAELLHSPVSLSDLSDMYGFSDVASYSKAFKKHFGVSPTAFREEHPNHHSRIRRVLSKNGQTYPNHSTYIRIMNDLRNWTHMNAHIEVKDLPTMLLAYLTCIGPKNLGDTYDKLIQWASPLGLLTLQTKMVTVYHDSFKFTEPANVRMSASILLEQPVEATQEVELATLEPGKCIVARFEIAPEAFETSWTGLFLWMKEHGYQKADKDPFEIYHNNMNEHPEGKAIVDFCIPVAED